MRRALSLALACVFACGQGASPPPAPPAQTTLAAGAVAKVGDEVISRDTVERIAVAQHVDVQRARDLAVLDALFAAEARAQRLDEGDEVRARITAALAHRLLQKLKDEALKAGPTTDAELAAGTERHWLELDRAEGFQAVHAVVKVPEGADDAKKKRASEIAEAMRAAALAMPELASSTARTTPDTAQDPLVEPFKHAVEAVPHAGFEILVEALPYVTEDGRVISADGGGFDKDFAKAAATLKTRGEVSKIVTSVFGVHVLVLLDRKPASVVPIEERRRILRDEVVSDRARHLEKALLEPLRPTAALDRNVDAILEVVHVTR